MRKLLLASAAVLSASMGMAGVANAQAPSPAPGTISVRLNGLVRFYAVAVSDHGADNNQSGYTNAANTALNGVGVTSVATANNPTTVTALSGGNKLARYSFGSYARLYPGFDGVAANGLKYGASLEIRQDQVSGAGGGIYGSIGQQDRARSGLYFKREFGYLGTDQLGTIRVGTTDQPTSLYITGTFENFDGGGLNGDIPGYAAGVAQATWPFSDSGNYYGTNKVVYLSPQFFGFDFGVSFEPNTGGENQGNNCGTGSYQGATAVNPGGAISASNPFATGANSNGAAGPGCDRLASTATGDYSRRRNEFDGLVRYRGTFGPVGVAATAAYMTSGRVLDSSTPQRALQYDDLSVGDFGAAVTAYGFSVGGHYAYGRFTGSGFALAPTGTPDSHAWLGGASYTIGPFVTGVQYVNYQYVGNTAATLANRQKQDVSFAAGATYSLVPGVTLFASYIYQQTRQYGVNQVTGETTGAGAALHNKENSNVFGLGTSFRW